MPATTDIRPQEKGQKAHAGTQGPIIIKGARVHNLRNVDVDIPRGKLVVITGLSGSGKSSLAFDTLYAEGQRRYVESLSSYARQFLGRLEKPDVDRIIGISPAIAIEQKVATSNPRSTVGTSTEVYDHMKLLFARVGRTFSPVSDDEVKRDTIDDVVAAALKFPEESALLIAAPVHIPKDRSIPGQLEILQQQGYARIWHQGEVLRIEDALEDHMLTRDLLLLVDRVMVRPEDEENNSRIGDSVETAFFEGHGECILIGTDTKGKEKRRTFNDKFELDGITFTEPSTNFFSFNDPVGACPTCEGYGSVIGIDPELVIPDRSLSLYDDAVSPWRGDKLRKWKERFIEKVTDFPIHRPINELDKEHLDLLWKGGKGVKGIDQFFKYVESKLYKIQYRVMLSRYRGKTTCPECNGSRLRKETNYVKVGGTTISELLALPIDESRKFFHQLKLNKHDAHIADRLLKEINNRLGYLSDVGVGYLNLGRRSNTLSGGETQRIDLATSLGSSLVGSMYILDEPSIGLHSRDTQRLIKVLCSLRDLGNTVVVVEHDEEVMQAADHIIDMGPLAGTNGGEVIFSGSYKALLNNNGSLTGKYLSGELTIPVPEKRRKVKDMIVVHGASEHNLKKIDVAFPLHMLTVVTGVSGSGKTTLVKRILYPALRRHLDAGTERPGEFTKLSGDVKRIEAVEMIDQNPIGRSSRSNPVTYVKAYDEIRALFADQQISKVRGYTPKFFSFNVDGGRCDVCQGEGEVRIEMQFMADIHLTCENCNGTRFREEILDARFQQKHIADILNMTIDEAITFFEGHDKKNKLCRRIVQRLSPLQEVGLGYVKLGQSSSTLSGGEAQRIKLASFLTKGKNEQPTLFIFDEPTTGLHFHDISKLLAAMGALITNGHSVIVIEHNIEMIKCADHVIDLGPEGGDGGGELLFEGMPEELVEQGSHTGKALKGKT